MPENPERLKKRVALRIRLRRRELSLTLAALADRMEVSVQYVNKCERGENLTIETLVKIANALDTTVIDLLRDDDVKKP